MRMKRLLVVLVSLAMFLTGMAGNIAYAQSTTANAVYISNKDDLVITPGDTTHFALPIRAKIYMQSPTISVNTGEAPFTINQPILTMNGNQIGGIDVGTGTNLEFDVKVKDTAVINDYPVTFTFTYSVFDFSSGGYTQETLTTSVKLKVQEEKDPAQLTIKNVSLANSNIGCNTNLSFKVSNEGEITAKSAYLVLDYGGIIQEEYSGKSIKIGDLAPEDTKNITLPVQILSAASAGRKTITGTFTYKTPDGTAKTSSYNIYVSLKSGTAVPQIVIDKIKVSSGLKPGDNFNLYVSLKNSGSSAAKKITAKIDSSSFTADGIVNNYYTDGISAASLKEDQSETVKIPLSVSKYATGGMKAAKILISYSDSNDNSYTTTETKYIDVTAAATASSSNIVITNVKQSVAQPEAGDEVDISFDVENNSKVDATQFKIYADGLTNATFIPVQSDPYQYIEKLKGGDKVKITMPFIVSKSIAEGLNNLTIKYSYTGGEGSAVIPVRNIKNDAGSSSIPKLIVSKYTTDKDELKAGSTFNFTYDIYNTNETVAAKNITITIAQADNVFTVTQGSNSFFINKINPGETVKNTIEMKVKSDATTKAYPITITIEYEYEGITANPETGQVGLTKTQTLSLNAEENARPVADNIAVSSWDGNVTVGTAATLSFDFYNMGKSVLSNVIATVEGNGFTKADGSMYFIGNVEAGSSSHVEFDVMPNSEGTVAGTLKISYENSNGDTISFTKDFTGDVMPAAATAAPGDMTGEVMNPNAATAKKAILPIWAFILIQIAIFVIFVPVTRKVIINAYKSKLRAKEEAQY